MVSEVEFFGSFERVEQCPALNLPEYALIGRSNVGKSSLINFITQKKELARISKKPGKTRHINLFGIDQKWVLADLPGYGFAHVSKTQRKKWDRELWRYLNLRSNLVCALVLVDASIPPQKADLEFLNDLGAHMVPWVLVYTKTDKVRKSKVSSQLDEIRNAILESWEELPAEFITSVKDQMGREEILDFIQINNQQLKEREEY